MSESTKPFSELGIRGAALMAQSNSQSAAELFNSWVMDVATVLSEVYPGTGYDLEWLALAPHGLIACHKDFSQRLLDFESAVRQRLQWLGRLEARPSQVVRGKGVRTRDKEVFVVHGRDEAALNSVKAFLLDLGLKPVILHEKANQGRHLLDKFEQEAEVGYAVVVATGDDVGRLKSDTASEFKSRPRQNVIFELGYFLGAWGRKNVCVLLSDSVEKPSDYDGVTWVPFPADSSWKSKLARELSDSGFPVDLKALLN